VTAELPTCGIAAWRRIEICTIHASASVAACASEGTRARRALRKTRRWLPLPAYTVRCSGYKAAAGATAKVNDDCKDGAWTDQLLVNACLMS